MFTHSRKCLVHLTKSLQVKYCSLAKCKTKSESQPNEKKNHTSEKNNKKQRNPDIVQYLEEHDPSLDVKCVPDKYLIKTKNAKMLYLVNHQAAESLANVLKPHLEMSEAKVIECHPGLGLLTHHLLQMNVTNVTLHEPDPLFYKSLLKLSSTKLTVFNNDILQIPKGSPTKKPDPLEYIDKNEWENDCIYQLIAALNNQEFLRYILRNFSNQNGILAFGRPIMYLLITPEIYRKVIAGPHESWNLYKPLAVLFQIIFHIELLSKVNRRALLPWPTTCKKTKSKENSSEDFMYLVRIEGKRDLYQRLGRRNTDRVKTLQKFVTHVIGRKKQRVIPTIEQWAPGFGPHLIARNINVYTNFNELTPDEIFDIFCMIQHIPGYEDFTIPSRRKQVDATKEKHNIDTSIDMFHIEEEGEEEEEEEGDDGKDRTL